MGESPLYFWADWVPSQMAMAIYLDHVREIAQRVTAASGLELVDLEFRGSGGKARMLRVFIDKSGGVTHADCEAVSLELGTILDVEDAVPGGSYTLEVSSPGLDRKLTRPEEFARFVGSKVKVVTREPIDGNRFFEGRLDSFREGMLSLVLSSGRKKTQGGEERQLAIAFSNVEKANLIPELHGGGSRK